VLNGGGLTDDEPALPAATVAAASGANPYELRYQMADFERLKAVLDLAAAKGDWRTPLTAGQGRGINLHSKGQANTLHGDGTLSTEAPGDEPPDVNLYSPLRPVPTSGGQVILPGGNAMGPRDQREVEERDDVLVYSSPVLDRPVEVTGPIELCLFAASSARDTDFTGKLVDVFPDG
jgi:putative CocE/NonD family hydrolase